MYHPLGDLLPSTGCFGYSLGLYHPFLNDLGTAWGSACGTLTLFWELWVLHEDILHFLVTDHTTWDLLPSPMCFGYWKKHIYSPLVDDLSTIWVSHHCLLSALGTAWDLNEELSPSSVCFYTAWGSISLFWSLIYCMGSYCLLLVVVGIAWGKICLLLGALGTTWVIHFVFLVLWELQGNILSFSWLFGNCKSTYCSLLDALGAIRWSITLF